MKPAEKRVRYAVVGAGNIAQVAVLPAFEHAEENSELVAIVSSHQEKRTALARRYGLRHTGSYDELERVLRDAEADAVYIALPNTMHRHFTERCASAKVHVLCEKPMATTEEDCRAMIAAADQNDVLLMIAYRLHFETANLCAIDIAVSGRIGEPKIVNSVFSQLVRPGDIRTRADLGGGALFDLGPYCVNAARYLFRAEPSEVFGYETRGKNGSSSVDVMTSASLRFAGDRIAQFTVRQDAAEVMSYRLVGTRGDLRVEPAFGYAIPLVHHSTIDGETRTREFPARDQFAAEISYFSRCIEEGTEPEPDGWEGLADVRVMTAIQKSARSRQPVTLAPFERTRRPDMHQNIEKPPMSLPEPIESPPPVLH